jgi:hypothetical protein
MHTRAGYRRNLRFEKCEDRRLLTVFTVTSIADVPVNTPSAIGTLRQAIFDAENLAGPDTIQFASNLNGATIRLQYIDQFNAALSIGRDVTIDAMMLPLGITLDALDTEIDPTVPGLEDGVSDGLRVFDIGGGETSDLTVTLAGLTMTGGNPIDGGAGAIEYHVERGMLTIRDCKIFGNFGFGEGAAETIAA